MNGVLTLVLLLAPDPPADPAEEWRVLFGQYAAAEKGFFAPYYEAKSDEEREKVRLDYERHPAREFVPKAKAFAESAKGTEAALDALLWLVRAAPQTGSTAEVGPAIDAILAGHAGSPKLEEFASYLRYAHSMLGRGAAVNALETLVRKSPHDVVRAAATLSLAATYAEADRATEADRKRARALLDTILEKYGETKYATQAKGLINEIEFLQIGKVAPDFEATDVDGKTFKLSDYRGQVVVLDFWGFW